MGYYQIQLTRVAYACKHLVVTAESHAEAIKKASAYAPNMVYGEAPEYEVIDCVTLSDDQIDFKDQIKLPDVAGSEPV